MAEHGALATLKDLAEKEVEDAARLLGEMRRGCQQAEEQLKMLVIPALISLLRLLRYSF